MFQSAKSSMPAMDYVSVIRSLYASKWSMVVGAVPSALVCVATAVKTQSILLYGVSACFMILAAIRWLDFCAFEKRELGDDDVDTASHWELRSTVGATATAICYGAWCFICSYFLSDPTAEVLSLSVSSMVLVGIVARNFSVDRLVTLQAAVICIPMTAGLALGADIYHTILAISFVPLIFIMRSLATRLRSILLSAVHGRFEASRLAEEIDAAMNTMQHALCMLTSDKRIAVMNEAAERLFPNDDKNSWQSRSFTDMVLRSVEKKLLSAQSATALIQKIETGSADKITLPFENGQSYEVTITSKYGRMVLLLEDVTERMAAHDRIRQMARYDSLTGLLNRNYFNELVGSQLEDAREKTALLAILDVDDFKHVNDSYGHPIGDELLVKIAERLQAAVGKELLISRFGGDEFTIFQIGDIDYERAQEIALSINRVCTEPFVLNSHKISTSLSVGAVHTIISDEQTSFVDLMTKADLALYAAKGQGKSNWKFFEDDMDTDYRYRQRLKEDLSECLENGGLSLHFQPIIDTKSQQIKGCEALARWVHPELGNIPPSLFIPVAEETGLISKLTAWVLDEATKTCANWPPDMYVSVNISATDFRSCNVREVVLSALKKSELPASQLEIEVTESVVIEQKNEAAEVLSELANLGIGVALDDFGTGYSSLSYLQHMPFTKLKIDRAFVIDVTNSERSLRLLSNIARLSKDLNLQVTVEGVETVEQLELVVGNAEVDNIQGYLFGKPLPSDQLDDLLIANGLRAKEIQNVHRLDVGRRRSVAI